eukprot:CAMPEP_0180274634 /NCGR_PEP_ID=MMETSP0988-20121125/5426_1 /TAXON_ID=697907 /ORGANISM="non described non described, Strain CCMP2293" /LENGTH=188 /DNA_ID=CAMNT_0022245871 /DNA_START=67 /DNA_END=629 /DNA_ORIENTATION=+
MGFWDSLLALVADEEDVHPTEAAAVSDLEVDFAEGLTRATFLHYPDNLSDQWVMTPAQAAHAGGVLAQSGNLRAIRRELSPSQLTDHQFWQIYFGVTQRDTLDAATEAESSDLVHAAPEADPEAASREPSASSELSRELSVRELPEMPESMSLASSWGIISGGSDGTLVSGESDSCAGEGELVTVTPP